MGKDKKLEARKKAIKRDYLSGFRAEERFFAGLSEEVVSPPSLPRTKRPQSMMQLNEWESFDEQGDEIF